MNKCPRLRELLNSGRTLVMPDAYDAVSARVFERLGFQAVQCSGFSIALAACCRKEPDLGLDENLRVTRNITQAVSVPVMADGEDGFGDASTIGETIRKYIQVGVAGINLEDQMLGSPGTSKQVVDCQLMVDKIAAARRAATEAGEAGLVINGRTDALVAAQDRPAGLKEAIRRSNRYLEAGADLAFVVGVASLDEVRTLVKEVAGPVSVAAGLAYNMSLSLAELQECGVARVSLPTLAVCASVQAIRQVLAGVLAGERFSAIAERGLLCNMQDIGDLLS
jgi:2-methylisocitrate lyase-like PEP mutase family enzyme